MDINLEEGQLNKDLLEKSRYGVGLTKQDLENRLQEKGVKGIDVEGIARETVTCVKENSTESGQMACVTTSIEGRYGVKTPAPYEEIEVVNKIQEILEEERETAKDLWAEGKL